MTVPAHPGARAQAQAANPARGPAPTAPGADDAISRQLVEAIIRDFPDHAPGTRPVHTLGVGAEGFFVASDVARQFCVAEHFQGHTVPVNVRFSNGSGSPQRHDGWSDVRGMATRFHLKDGGATDLIAMTLGSFFSATVPDFLAFCQAAEQTPVVVPSAWQKLLGMLQLKPPPPDPPAGQTMNSTPGTLAYANAHRPAQLAVFSAATIGAPVSYARASFHAVHTFIVLGADQVRRPVRFVWQPVAGVATTDPKSEPVDDYLTAELKNRFAQWPAEFVLMMTIGERGDDYADPTRPWPAKRQRVVMGLLSLTKLADDQVRDGEKISFNPCRVVPGIALSEDPILHARRGAYETSRQMRGGTGCPFHPEA